MEQYWRLFTSYRVPSNPVDKLDMATNRMLGRNEHLVVICNNQVSPPTGVHAATQYDESVQFFKIDTVIDGERISQIEINKLLSDAVDAAKSRQQHEVAPVGLTTAVHRDKAAMANDLLERG